MKKVAVKRMVHVAMLIALEVILSRFVPAVNTQFVKLSFSFIPVAIAAMIYGPVYGAITGALADFIGAILFPIAAYFPGFTLTAALTGAVFGLLLRKKDAGIFRVVLASAIVAIPLSLFLNSFWLTILFGSNYVGLLATRIVTSATSFILMIPILLGCRKLLSTKWMSQVVYAGQ